MLITTIEDCLETMAGLSQTPVTPSFIILDRDKQILIDIAKKVFKGSALTDRQHETVKKILISRYKTQFKNRKIDLENSVNNLRQPIRYIDRSEYIKIENGEKYNEPLWAGYVPKKVIVVRFPFNMTYSKLIQEVKRGDINDEPLGRFYVQRFKDKHILPYTEKTVYSLLSKFKKRIKDIDQELLNIYDDCEKIIKNKKDYVPGIYNYEIKHSSDSVINFYKDFFGEPAKENLYLYYDRKEKLGLRHFDMDQVKLSLSSLSNLTQKILNRKYSRINLDLEKWPLNQIVESILELKRIPLLIVIPGTKEKDSLEGISKMHKIFKNLIPSEDISVLVRMKNSTKDGKDFNNYIKEQKINNSLAENTKIVYITNKKVPKPLLMSTWDPEAVLICDNTRNYTKVDQLVSSVDVQFQINGHDSFWNQMHFGSDTI